MKRHKGGSDEVREQAASAGDAKPVDALVVYPDHTRQLRTPRAAGIAGIIFALLLVASFLLVRFPASHLNDAELVAWFKNEGASDLILVGLYLVPFAGIAFLWFIAVIRDRIGRFEDRFFATVLLGSGLLFIAMLFAGIAVAGGLVAGRRFYDETAYPTAGLIRSTRALASTLIFVYGSKTAGVFVLVTNTIAMRVRMFSRWFALVGFLVGLLLIFNVGFNLMLLTVFPAWVGFLSVYLLVTASRLRKQVEQQPSAY
jgi:hypothetical protein